MTQSQTPSSKKDDSREANRSSNDAKSRVCSPISNSTSANNHIPGPNSSPLQTVGKYCLCLMRFYSILIEVRAMESVTPLPFLQLRRERGRDKYMIILAMVLGAALFLQN